MIKKSIIDKNVLYNIFKELYIKDIKNVAPVLLST
jgi:hypothetical protein